MIKWFCETTSYVSEYFMHSTPTERNSTEGGLGIFEKAAG